MKEGFPDVRQNYTKRPIDAPMTKGSPPQTAGYAKGGPAITGRSIFMKAPDPFRTDDEPSEYGKTGKGGKLSDLEGDGKALPAIKPRK